MAEEEKIELVIEKYIEALRNCDFNAISRHSTERLLAQYNWVLKLVLNFTKLINPSKMRNLEAKGVTIESVTEDKALAHYSLDWGKRHTYERVVLIKIEGLWKIDGKFV